MSVSICNVAINDQGKELTPHGDALFPVACYDEDFLQHLVPWHWHDDFEVILITEGCAHINVEHQCIPVHAGNALVINAGILHSVNGGIPEAAHCHSMVFHPRLIGGSIDSVFWHQLVLPMTESTALHWLLLTPSLPWQADTIADLTQAWEAMATMPKHFELTIRHLLSRAFITLTENLPIQTRVPAAKDRLAANRTKEMMQYIHQHYAEELSLKQIANCVALSESVCLRSFRRMIGTTPIQYLLQYRIEKAAALLTTTDDKIKDIALASGFSDFSYFTKCFRRFKACTPVAYRGRLTHPSKSADAPH